MNIPIYQVDAFTDQLFGGNPAAVCLLNEWLADDVLLKIAQENNLSETAYLVGHAGQYQIRWFTPGVEVALCGHATLAAAYVVLHCLHHQLSKATFMSKSGELIVTKNGQLLTLEFPIINAQHNHDAAELVTKIIGFAPEEVYKGDDFMVVLKNEAQVRTFIPDYHLIRQLPARGLSITAPGNNADFVSRWFGPQVEVYEDPVNGSSHCMLAAYWSKRLNKNKLYAEQLSKRGGKIHCEVAGQRVLLSGHAVLYLQGQITI